MSDRVRRKLGISPISALHNRRNWVDFSAHFPLIWSYNINMWKTILQKVQAGVLAYWSQVLWFILGGFLGVVLLGGLVSCTTVKHTWNGVKDATTATINAAEDVVGAAYKGAKNVGEAVINTAEGVVEGVAADAKSAVQVVTEEKEESENKEN